MFWQRVQLVLEITVWTFLVSLSQQEPIACCSSAALCEAAY